MPRTNVIHQDGQGQIIHAADVGNPDQYLAWLSAGTQLATEAAPAGSGTAADPSGQLDGSAALGTKDGAASGGRTLLPPGTYRISASMAFSNPVQFLPGAKLSLDAGVVVTFNGTLIAAATQIFSGSGTVAFGAGSVARVYAEWFGTGAGNTWDLAINAAIAATGASPRGGVVQLLARDYATSNPVAMNKDRVSLIGAGRQATRIVNNNLAADALQITGLNSHVFLRDLEITGVLAGRTAGNAVTISNCGTGVTLERLYCDGHVDGVNLGASVVEPFLKDVIFSSCTGSFLHIDPGAGSPAVDPNLDTIFMGSPSGSSAIGINIAAVSGLYARMINITGSFQNAMLWRATASGQQNDWGFWDECLFDSATNSCLLIDSAPAYGSVNSHTFNNCWFASSATLNGVEINGNTAGFTLDGLFLNDCRFYHNGHEGLHQYGSLATIKNVYLANPHVAANSQAASGAYNGLLFDGNTGNFHVKGGHSGQEASGSSGYGNTQNYGLVVSAGSGDHWDVEGLNCENNGNASGIFVGTQSNTHWYVANCPPYNPRGVLGPPALPASGTALVNPYGSSAMVYLIGGTVSAISVGGVATGLTSTPATVRVPAKSSITIGYSVAPSWVWAVE